LNEAAGLGPSAAPPLEPAALLGRELDRRYRLLFVLGRGSFGAVYRAFDRHTGVELAVKVLLQPADPEALARFLKEAEVLSSVRHQNVVAIRGQGQDRATGVPYVAMELVEGPDLHKMLSARLASGEGPFPPAELIEIGGAILRGLAHLHRHGVIHGDLNPANVLMGRVPKLTDFGMAVLASVRPVSGMIAGTPAYMAPEVTMGVAANTASDLYSLGCMFYELLTGAPPVTGATPEEIMERQRTDAPPPLRGVRAEVPEPLEAMILSLLAKERGRRPPSANDAYWALMGAAGKS
jgi:serine/threonine-protein kinase